MSLEEFMIAMGFPPISGDQADVVKSSPTPTKKPKKPKFE